MSSQRSSDIIDTVAEEARLDSRREAGRIVASVARAMATHFGPAAWQIVAERIPDTANIPRSDNESSNAADIDAFFEEVADYEELSPAVAARYARIVAEAVKDTMPESELARLSQELPDEYLALFESDHRSELTEPNGLTDGVAVVEEKEGHARPT